MKKSMTLLIAIVTGVVVTGTVFADSCCQSGTAKSCDMMVAKAPKAKAAKAVKEEYVCPMCPGVVSDTPGKCPKCGMNLEKKQPAVKAKAVTKKAAKAAAVVYSCPMHPEVTGDKAGKCPKCGMFLEKQTTTK